MKTRIYIIAILALGIISAIESQAQGNLEITIRKIKEAKGTIRIGLFASEDNFLKNALLGKVIKATAGEMTVVFENLKPGDYAISVIHDENENGELDSNLVGIPKEGFAFGNNAMGTFGPPSFEKAKVAVGNKKESQAVDMRYF